MTGRLRVLLHALDRTGPPMLAAGFLRWLAEARPELAVDVVAFRGGPLADELPPGVPVAVLTRPDEPWDHAAPDAGRVEEVEALLRDLPAADVVLAVSVAAGQCLPHLPGSAPVVTWAVEQGEDLHWLEAGVGLVERTVCWLAGTEAVAAEVRARAGVSTVSVVPEFVADPVPVDPAAVAEVRAACGVGEELLVVGAGIATARKAPDLFLEVALAHLRAGGRARYAWVGGERDPLWAPVAAELDRLGLGDRASIHPSTRDLDAWLAAADVLVHPARLDAYPLVCLQAALADVPVVAFAGVGGVEEMFGPSFLGAPYPDVVGLARCVADLEDPERRRSVGAAQAARARSRGVASAAAPRLLAELEAAS